MGIDFISGELQVSFSVSVTAAPFIIIVYQKVELVDCSMGRADVSHGVQAYFFSDAPAYFWYRENIIGADRRLEISRSGSGRDSGLGCPDGRGGWERFRNRGR